MSVESEAILSISGTVVGEGVLSLIDALEEEGWWNKPIHGSDKNERVAHLLAQREEGKLSVFIPETPQNVRHNSLWPVLTDLGLAFCWDFQTTGTASGDVLVYDPKTGQHQWLVYNPGDCVALPAGQDDPARLEHFARVLRNILAGPFTAGLSAHAALDAAL